MDKKMDYVSQFSDEELGPGYMFNGKKVKNGVLVEVVSPQDRAVIHSELVKGMDILSSIDFVKKKFSGKQNKNKGLVKKLFFIGGKNKISL